VTAADSDTVPEVPITVTVYACCVGPVMLFAAPQPASPVMRTMAAASSNGTKAVRPKRLPALRSLPAKGSIRSPSAIGAILEVSFRSKLLGGSLFDAFCGNWTVKVTGVVLAPTGTVVGEKLYVAPAGNPLATRLTAVGNVVTGDIGVTVKANPAEPPGDAVAEELDAFIVKSTVGTLSALPLMVYVAVSAGLLQ